MSSVMYDFTGIYLLTGVFKIIHFKDELINNIILIPDCHITTTLRVFPS